MTACVLVGAEAFSRGQTRSGIDWLLAGLIIGGVGFAWPTART